MKIAILTQPLGKNYGGVMQAYALQKVIRDLGHDVTTIDYNNAEYGLLYKVTRLSYRVIQKLMGRRKAPINIEAKLPYILESTRQFIQQYISMSEYIDNDATLKKHFQENSYDVVVVGSDQTWRPKYSQHIYNFYLEFLENNKTLKKIAYASSFGVDNWEYSEEETVRCSELAVLFDAISVREQSGIELCKKYLGVDSECVLDPTLLLNREDYLALVSDRYNAGRSEGVFTYFLDNNQLKMAVAEKVCKQLNTYVYKCQAICSLGDWSSSSLGNYKMPALQDWLASLANAEFVVTDSFHGMVFSIIFGKPFLVIVNKERGAARFYSLLKKLDGIKCLLDDPKAFVYNEQDIKSIRPLIFRKVESERASSFMFLKEVFNDEQKRL